MSSSALRRVRKDLRKYGSRPKAKLLQRFFKTGPGEYAEGDVFLGVMVPATRLVAGRYKDLGLKDTLTLLTSRFHEERLTALLILIDRFRNSGPQDRRRIYRSYLAHTRCINNWDLVDLSAGHIVGAFLWDKEKKPLYTLARSRMLWERRIAIVATSYFIGRGRFTETLRISRLLLKDKEDLMHKASGWMLREVGKRDQKALETFLKTCYRRMPRTMLRYAIERFPEKKRQRYLRGTA